MPYSKEIFDAASARLAERRRAAESENAATRRGLYEKLPRLKQIDTELSSAGLRAARAVLAGSGARERIEKLRDDCDKLEAERTALLKAGGYPDGILTINYFCPKCRDTGYVGDEMCSCMRSLLLEEACRRANSGSPLQVRDFSSFDLSYYPDTPLPGLGITVRAYMSRVLERSMSYAADFPAGGGSLLMLGGTGLGKTHLSLAVAGAVLSRGFGVICDTAQNILDRVEDEGFGRGERGYTQSVFSCDLLILDDLPGYASSRDAAALYNIINTRTLSSRPMIVSTNLTESELAARYGDKIFSRLIGDFMMLKFFGSDIRQLRLEKGPQ